MADTIIDLQIQKFAELGLSYDNGFSLSNKIHENLNMPKISSQHRILFGSISLIKNVKSILEIGTFKGKNAKF